MFSKKKGFTLAEVLATLGVIGVVAVITIPSVVTDIRSHVFTTRRQAISADVADIMKHVIMTNGRINKATNTEDFVKNYLTKSMNAAKVCANNKVTDCGIRAASTAYLYPNAAGSVGSFNYNNAGLNGFKPSSEADDNMWAARTTNGVSMLIAYRQACTSDACVNIIYDVNGEAGPNVVGKDVGFMTVFGRKTGKVISPVLQPNIAVGAATDEAGAINYCKKFAPNGEAGIPSFDEAKSLRINAKLLNASATTVASYKDANGSGAADATGLAVCIKR